MFTTKMPRPLRHTQKKTELSLKLLIDKKSNKVLFGEGNKDFIDFLFSLMSIPVGSLINLLSKEKMVGSLGDLYGSIEKLSDTYVQPNQNKETILKTESTYFAADSRTLLISNEPTDTVPKKYYRCDYNCNNNITNTMETPCSNCRRQMNTEVTLVGSTDQTGTNNAAASVTTGEGGYVKGVVTYMVMDNLVVMPMSTISSITLLNQFKVQDVGTLEEKVVYLGMDEGLELLNASLQSKTVLSDVFLSEKQVKSSEEVKINNMEPPVLGRVFHRPL